MEQIERLIQNYDNRVSLPWERNLAGPQRVWFAVYNKAEERRLRKRLDEFEISTKRAKYGWVTIDLTDAFAHWLSAHEYRDGYFETPEHLEGGSPAVDDFKEGSVLGNGYKLYDFSALARGTILVSLSMGPPN